MRFVESHNMIIFASANVSYYGRYTCKSPLARMAVPI